MSADPSVSVERVDQLFSLYQRMQADQASKEFTQAFIAAQSEMEGYAAMKSGRKFIGCELKESYWRQAVRNISDAENTSASGTLFDFGTQEKVA